ncbi:hypothetical protein [Streptomyces sp. NPDC093984]
MGLPIHVLVERQAHFRATAPHHVSALTLGRETLAYGYVEIA